MLFFQGGSTDPLAPTWLRPWLNAKVKMHDVYFKPVGDFSDVMLASDSHRAAVGSKARSYV